jgi:hypothetical protein
MATVEQRMEGVLGHLEDAQKGVDYGKGPTVRGRNCNMTAACKKDAEFTAVDNSPQARADAGKTEVGEPVVHDACEDHAGKIWRLGLQVVAINAHVPAE